MCKKCKITIIFFVCVVVLSACGKKDEQMISSNLFEKSELNSFFIENEFDSQKFKGRFSSSSEEEGMIERDVYIQVEKITELKSGVIYKLKIQPIRGVPEERLLLGTFYVQKDKVYKIEYTKKC